MKLDMKEIIRLGLILLLICAVSATLLAFTNGVTIDKILEQRAIASENDRKAVLPTADTFKPMEEAQFNELSGQHDKLLEVYVGYSGDSVVGYVIKTAPGGYGGPIEITTGLDNDGLVGGVRMGSNHQETPGLGAKAALPEFYDQYNGMDALAGISVVKANPVDNQILAISGATITSDAMTDGVNMATEVFESIMN